MQNSKTKNVRTVNVYNSQLWEKSRNCVRQQLRALKNVLLLSFITILFSIIQKDHVIIKAQQKNGLFISKEGGKLSLKTKLWLFLVQKNLNGDNKRNSEYDL